MADVRIVLDEQKVYEAIQNAHGTPDMLSALSQRICAKANVASATYRTAKFYNRDEHQLKGGKRPVFKWNVQKRGRTQVGLVYTANYAAQKINHEQNTLLKSTS